MWVMPRLPHSVVSLCHALCVWTGIVWHGQLWRAGLTGHKLVCASCRSPHFSHRLPFSLLWPPSHHPARVNVPPVKLLRYYHASRMRHASLLSLAWFWCRWIVGARCRSLRGVWPHLFFTVKRRADWDASTPLTPSAAGTLAVEQSNRHREANTEEDPLEVYCTHVPWKQSRTPSSCYLFKY